MRSNRIPRGFPASLGVLALALCPACGKLSDTGTSAPTTGWQGQQLLEATSTLGSTAGGAGVDSFGNGLALWQKTGTSSLGLWGDAWSASSGWLGDGGVPSGNAPITTSVLMDIRVAVGGTGVFTYVCDPSLGASDSNVWAGAYKPSGGMGTPVRLNASGTYAWQPRVAAGASGNACAAWTEAGATYDLVKAAYFAAGASAWTSPVQVSAGTANALNPRVGVDSQGDVVVAWVQAADPANGPFTLWVSRYSAAAGAWSAPASPQAGNLWVSPEFSLAMTDAGAQLAWAESTDGATAQVYTTRWSPTADAWSSPVRVSTGGVFCDRPAVGIDAQGNALLVWEQGVAALGGAAPGLYAANYTKAAGWQNVAGIGNATGTAGVFDPQLSMNASGSAALVFRMYDGTSWRVLAALFTAGYGWGNAGFIQTSTGGDAGNSTVCMGAGGTILAAWDQPDTSGISHPYGNVYLQ